MIFRSKKADASRVIWIIVMLAVAFAFAAVLLYILGKSGNTLDDVFVECSGIGGGVWSQTRCDPSVSVESPVVERTQGYYCCIPLPGSRDRFETFYADAFELDINKNGVKNSGSGSSSGSSSGSTNNDPIQFVLNDKPITIAKTTVYTTGMSTNGMISSKDKHTFQVLQNIKEPLGKCSISIYPAKIDDKTQKIFSNTLANDEHKITFEQPNCEKSITVSDAQLALLDGQYAEPGFYKWDFKYWKKGNTGDQWDGSETTFISVKEGGGAAPGKLTHETIRVSRDNVATCYLFIGVLDDAWDERLPENSTYNYEGGTSKQITTLPTPPVILRPNEEQYSVTFNFSEENITGSPYSVTYSFAECNSVVVFDLDYYNTNYKNCPSMVCDYSRNNGCLDASSTFRGQDMCNQDLENCHWDYATLGGTCLKCTSEIKSCSDYGRGKDNCKSNQCFDGVNMKERCYARSATECVACSLNPTSVACEDYTKKTNCEEDPCNYKDLMGATCKWESGKCTIA